MNQMPGAFVGELFFSPFYSSCLIIHKSVSYFFPDNRFCFYLCFCPNANFKDPLNFFRQVMPAIIIASLATRQIIINSVFASSNMRFNMICLEIIIVQITSTDMTF